MYLDKLKLRAKELEDLYLCKDNLYHVRLNSYN